MNGFYNDYNRVVIETPEERQEKIKRQRKLFSRVFLALTIYILASQFASTGVYYLAHALMTPEQYSSFYYSSFWTVLTSCVSQYLIAFPVMIIALAGTKKSFERKQKRLSLSEFFVMFVIGEALMYAGSLIGNILNQFIGDVTGVTPENNVSALISEMPLWLMLVAMVIIGPIVEELIFRKILIDRLSIYGDKMAIIFSSIAFGLMHGNLYQFFYAALLGLLLGYVYASTRNLKYTIYIHMIVNFIGSIVTLKVQDAIIDFTDGMTVLQLGEPVNILALLVSGTVTVIYLNLQYGLIIGGIIALIHYIRKKKFSISQDKEIFLPDKEIAKNGIVNFGAISFLTLSVILLLLNLFFA